MGASRLVLAAAATAAILGCVGVLAQTKSTSAGQGNATAAGQTPAAANASESVPPGVTLIEPPPETPANATAHARSTNSASNSLAGAEAPPQPPPVAPKPVRSPAGAILQALDKVTAETMRFAAPVGQPVRYKNLVFTVRACETSGLGGAEPEANAYVVIESAPLSAPGVPAPPRKEVYRGWMYANSPALHPFQHPIYDAWLIACMASAPRA